MGSILVERVICVLLLFEGSLFDLLLVVTLLGVLKDTVEPVRWLICVAASLVTTY